MNSYIQKKSRLRRADKTSFPQRFLAYFAKKSRENPPAAEFWAYRYGFGTPGGAEISLNGWGQEILELTPLWEYHALRSTSVMFGTGRNVLKVNQATHDSKAQQLLPPTFLHVQSTFTYHTAQLSESE